MTGRRRCGTFTVVANKRSQRVMEKLGMTHDPADDFDHPQLPEDSPLSRHVLYRLARQDPPSGESSATLSIRSTRSAN